MLTSDFGDAPDTSALTGPGNYQTLLSNGGSRHVIDATQNSLFLGARVDGEPDATPNVDADGDDSTSAPDDEDGLVEPAQDLILTVGSAPVVRVRATNTTGASATLYGWIDYNRDGVFDNVTERTSVVVPTASSNVTFGLTFPSILTSTVPGLTYARFRISTDVAAAISTGVAQGGEVEDYPARITKFTDGTADSTKSVKISDRMNGGPTLFDGDNFGRTLASLGDLDGDGVVDLAVGAFRDDTGGGFNSDRGVIYVQFMNSNGSVKNSVKIASDMNGGPTLADSDYFGSSIASLGDLDGDGVTDLAVGAPGDDTGGNNRGAVHILLLNSNGTSKSNTKVANSTNGGPVLANSDYFGTSMTALGDLDGDGVIDLAVGAPIDGTSGFRRGAVHILLLKSTGEVKSNIKITSSINGGPAIADRDYFGDGVATIGDLDGDGITDLAVGAPGDDTGGSTRGSVHVLFMNTNGTVKSNVKIASGMNNGPTLLDNTFFGFSVASLGDVDGDGVTDLAVGAPTDNTGGVGRGAVQILLLNSNGTVKSSKKIASSFNGGPTLHDGDSFGISVTSLGDLDSDGVTDLAIGAYRDSTGGLLRGAVHVLFLNRLNTASPVFTSTGTPNAAENGTGVLTVTATDADFPAQTISYSLTGGLDQAKFQITSGGVLTFLTAPNFESPTDANADNVYLVQVTANDGAGGTTVQNLSVTVSNVNESPTDISLASTTLAENNAANAVVGTLGATDPDSGNSFTFSLVGGAGSTDNASFSIVGNVLKITPVADFETKNSYSIRVQAADQGTLTFEKQFTITITNVNETPSDVSVSPSSIAENNPTNAVVGTLGTTDPDTGNTFSYTLVSGLGSLNNSSFTIVNGQLLASASFDFETKTSYSVRVRTTDQDGRSFEKPLTISVSNVNESPIDIGVSPTAILENRPIGSVVGALTATDPDVGETLTFDLVAGAGGTDNSSFTILNGQLLTASIFNFEAKSSYAIRVRVTDFGGLTFEKPFTINVNNANEQPTDISLSATTIAENQASGTVVGVFNSTDPDSGNTFTYSLAAGAGSTDNASFTVSNGQLKTAASFNFEAKNSYLIRVRTTDQGGFSFEKPFTILVADANDAPTDISLSATSIAENQSFGSVVGLFSSTDPDVGNTFAYSLVAGTGSTDNSSFTILNGQLLTAVGFDFETKTSHSIRVSTTDQGGMSFERQFTISVTDVNEAPTDIALSATTIAENLAGGSVVGTLSSSDPDPGNVFGYSLVTGTGSADNSSFAILDGQLLTAASFDFEAKNSYSIRVSSTDQGGLSFEKQFTIAITNLNESPTISNIANQSIQEDGASGVLNFTVGDPETSAAALTITATSSNLSLIPNANLMLSGTGAGRGLTVTPVADQSGTATITLLVSDGTNSTNTTFLVTVNAVNDAPTMTSVLPQTIQEDTATGPLMFTIGDVDNAVAGLTLSATSSNTALIPNGNIVIGGTGASRTLVITPAANQSGSATISVTVNDGTLTTIQTIQVTVQAVDDVPVLALSSQPLVFHVAAKKVVPLDGTATISDVDTPTLVFAGAVLRVSGHAVKDTLSIMKQNGISLKGKNVLSGTTVIGTLTGSGKKGAALVINLNATATQASVQSLLRSIGFKSTDKVPGSRAMQTQITNIGGKNSNPANRQIQVGP